MKIITKGDKRAGWEGRWSCNACGCVWTMEAGDVPPKLHDDWSDGDYYEMKCPTCGRLTTRAVVNRLGGGHR